MRDKFNNSVSIKGYVFNHSLSKKVSGPNSKTPGVAFISGDLNVATDPEAMNVVPVHFTYVTETYKNGNANATYALLSQIIDENNTYEVNGKSALKVRIDASIENNDFVTRDGEMASPKRVGGSFAHPETGDIETIGCAEFKADMLIEKYVEVEVDNGDNYGRLSGYVMNFRNEFVEVDFTIRSQGGMNYFDGLDVSVSQPVLTQVWGDIVSTTIETKTETESAFGAPTVKISTRNLRSWDVVGASPEPYEFGDDGAMSAADVTKLKAIRATYLDGVRKRHDEYQASREGNAFAAAAPATNASPTASSDYKF